MTILQRRPALRWLVPLIALVVLAGGGAAVGALTASARSGLPDRSAAALLVDVQKARLDGLSGTIVQNAELGLPSLPGVGGSGSSDLTSMVAGSHTLRLWYAGPNQVRVALLGSLGESDVIRNGKDLWTWSSDKRSATHRVAPVVSDKAHRSLAAGSPLTPQDAAETALAAISPTTKVSTDGTAVVAGRSAYELVLDPRDPGSLVGSVRIAIDGETHIPIRVQVLAESTGKTALEVGFTSFDPTQPEASVFRFNPPPGTKVTEAKELAPRTFLGHSAEGRAAERAAETTDDLQPKVVGAGWTSVLLGSMPSADGPQSASLNGALRVLPRVSGSWGSGRLLKGTLFSALVTDDGKVAVGAVAPERLYAALTQR